MSLTYESRFPNKAGENLSGMRNNILQIKQITSIDFKIDCLQ
jgi:hypothetical protein